MNAASIGYDVYPRRCPVCRQTVIPNIEDRIPTHRDGIGRLCPTTGFPYRITTPTEEI